MGREKLTATMLNTLLGCMRKFFYRFELGLQPTVTGEALSFGSAWHRAMEARWKGESAEAALAAAVAEVQNLDELQVATLAGLLRGYYAYYKNDPIKELMPEQEFAMPLARSRTFDAAGKIDGLGTLSDGRKVLLEHKTTSDPIDAESDYWLRLRANLQIMQYVHAARAHDFNVEVILYDVVKKPAIRPKEIPVLDESGKKIVLDATGQRVMKKDGSPRESAGDGMKVQTRQESSEEFGDRLAADCAERPEFYFARREVPILDQDLAEFEIQRLALSRLLLLLRRDMKRADKPHQAWPRNCGQACSYCDYSEFCLQNISVDRDNPPAGFTVGDKTPELSQAV
jgi:CRISPR/Cas system-associated exonuclease Cas4 (RecB family)